MVDFRDSVAAVDVVVHDKQMVVTVSVAATEIKTGNTGLHEPLIETSPVTLGI
jgi:hypothetical protein